MPGNLYRKTALDMAVVQGTWAFWFAAIVFTIYFGSRIFGFDIQAGGQIGELVTRIMTGYWLEEMEKADSGFFSFIAHPAKIFMLVCGIISVPGFLTYYVRQGVTRKAYFIGAAIVSAVLALALAAGSGLIYLAERMLFAPDIDLDRTWIAAVAAFAFNILHYYVFGWLIGAGFYRYGAGGLLFVVLAVAFAFAAEALWGTVLADWLRFSDPAGYLVAVAGSLLLLAILLGLIRMITRNVRVRPK